MPNQPSIPVDVGHLLPILNTKLIALLKSLSPDDWQKQNIAKLWKVKDVAAHTYRSVRANDGTLVKVTITTDIGGSWYLLRKAGK